VFRSCNHSAIFILLLVTCRLVGCSAEPRPAAVAESDRQTPAGPSAFETDVSQPASEKQHDASNSREATTPPTLPVAAGATAAPEPSAKQLLRWKFAAGDVIRYELSLNQKLTVDNDEFQNKKTVRFRWTVLDVDADGLASIVISFERVQLDLQQPAFQYDSEKDRYDVEPSGDAATVAELLAARALLSSVVFIKAMSRGGNTPVFGAEAVFGASQFTPGDFPTLPEQPIGLHDTWRIPITVREPMQEGSGFSNHLFKAEETTDGRRVLVLECRTEMNEVTFPAVPAARIRSNPTTTVNRFDPDAGRFVSRTIQGGFTITDAAGRETHRTNESRQELLPTLPEHHKSPLPPPTMILGAPGKGMTIVLHSKWNDSNNNRTIKDGSELSELEGIKSVFSVDDNICLALFVEGLKDVEFGFALLSTRGEVILTSKIPLASDNVFVYRQINAAELPGPGVYFFFWFLNKAFTTYTAVQVTPSMELWTKQAAALAQEFGQPADRGGIER